MKDEVKEREKERERERKRLRDRSNNSRATVTFSFPMGLSTGDSENGDGKIISHFLASAAAFAAKLERTNPFRFVVMAFYCFLSHWCQDFGPI